MITSEPLPSEGFPAEDHGPYPGGTGELRPDTRRERERIPKGHTWAEISAIVCDGGRD